MIKKINSKSQILITGVYRSGTEYLSALINSHPKISSTMYRVNFFRYIYNNYNHKDNKINYNKLISDFSKRLKFRYKKKINEKKFVDSIKSKDYGGIYDQIMTNLYLNKKKINWAEKNQLQWREIETFLKIMKNGKCIHILRDPRAVMLSYKKFTFHRKPAYLSSAFNSIDAMYYILLHNKKFKKNFLFLRYEDLINNKIKTLNKIWSFLGVKKLEKINLNNLWNGDGKKWKKNTTQTTKFFNEKIALNNWKNELSKREILFVETICHNKMKKFNYKFTEFKSEVNFKLIKQMIKKNKLLKYGYDKWIKSKFNLGFQAYPADPTNKKNWKDSV